LSNANSNADTNNREGEVTIREEEEPVWNNNQHHHHINALARGMMWRELLIGAVRVSA
jgi:hypothetical protein